MKKTLSIITFLFVALVFTAFNYATPENDINLVVTDSETINILYFHHTKRCATCTSIEKVTEETIKQYYPKQVESGKISTQSIDMDDDAGALIAKHNKVSSQSLIILKGSKRIDLTNDAFMYARSKPNKLKAKIKEAVDSLMK